MLPRRHGIRATFSEGTGFDDFQIAFARFFRADSFDGVPSGFRSIFSQEILARCRPGGFSPTGSTAWWHPVSFYPKAISVPGRIRSIFEQRGFGIYLVFAQFGYRGDGLRASFPKENVGIRASGPILFFLQRSRKHLRCGLIHVFSKIIFCKLRVRTNPINSGRAFKRTRGVFFPDGAFDVISFC